MQEDEKKTAPDDDMALAWMKMGMDFWQGITQPWLDAVKTSAAANFGDSDGLAAMGSALRKWSAFYDAMATQGSMDAILKGTGSIPALLVRTAEHTFNGFTAMLQKWIERVGRLGETAEAYRFEQLDQNMFRAWREAYENEFQRFLNIPQLGLLRSYQEKIQRMFDKYTLYQADSAEFVRVLSLPLSRSITVLDEKLAELAKNGKLPHDPQEYYRMWVKILEGHYMALYQSPEYLEILGRMLASLTDFSAARDGVFEDVLSQVPVPSRREIDDLEHELFQLKKRLKALEARDKMRFRDKQRDKQGD